MSKHNPTPQEVQKRIELYRTRLHAGLDMYTGRAINQFVLDSLEKDGTIKKRKKVSAA